MFKIEDYVYEVYKEKSFTLASKKLYVSQPALSASIKKLETELGVELFDRTSKPLRLTEIGELYIKMIEDTRRIKEDFYNKAYEINNMKKGSITVGGANFMSSCVLPEIIKTYSTKYGGIAVNLVESNSNDLKEKTLIGEIDVVLDYGFDENIFDQYLLKEENVYLALSLASPVAKKLSKYSLNAKDIIDGNIGKVDYLPLNKVKDESFVLLKKGNDMEERATHIFKEYDIKPNIALRLDQLMTAFNVSMKGLGLCFVTDTLIKSIEKPDCIFFKIKSRYSTRKIYIAHKKNIAIRKSVKTFIEVAVDTVGKI